MNSRRMQRIEQAAAERVRQTAPRPMDLSVLTPDEIAFMETAMRAARRPDGSIDYRDHSTDDLLRLERLLCRAEGAR